MTLDDDDDDLDRRALARLSAERDLAEHDLGLFVEMTSPPFTAPEHLRPLLDALDRSMREPVYALVEAPPRHGKTETLLHAAARRLRYRPTDSVAYCSYAAPLALRKSRKTREIAARAGVWTGDEELRRSRFDPSNAVSYWQTIDGGSFTAGGRGGSFIGEGYQFVIYDDPFKNREEAESAIYQEKALETWRGTLANRIEPGGSAFVTHQAWNDLDVIAALRAERDADGLAWEVISLPAVMDAEYDERGRLVGGTPLWPARWSLEALARRKHDVKDYNWFSQYIPERRPRGDRLFRDPARYLEPTIDGAVVIISCDPGIEADEMKDSSGIVVASAYRRASPHWTRQAPDFDLYLDVLHAEDQWRDLPDLLDYLETLQRRLFRGAPILLEEVSAFKVLSQMAKRLKRRLDLKAITPRGNKYFRAQPTAAAWNEGRIRTPIDADWVPGFHDEAKRFTGKHGGKDNRIDALTQLYDHAEPMIAAIVPAETSGESTFAASGF